MTRPALRWSGLAVVCSLVALGCTAGDAGDFGSSGGNGSVNATGVGPANGSTGNFGPAGTGSGMGCEVHCSADLHRLIDCDGNVVTECPPDQGCTPGGCTDPCTAANENKTAVGCDFYSVTPSIIAESRGSCFAMMIANTWTSPINVSAEYAGQSIDAGSYLYIPQGTGPSLSYQLAAGGQLAPGQLGIFFLSQYDSGDIFHLACPVPTPINTSTQIDGTGSLEAFRVLTTAPAIAYDVYPWGGSPSFATSATLLLPTPTWGTNFVTADAWEANLGVPFTQIVAAQDATQVTLVSRVAIGGGGIVPSSPPNTPVTFTLNAGQVAQIAQAQRLAGTAVQSDKPISIWGGHTAYNIPTGIPYADAAHQQLLPVQSLGNRYVVARYPSRGGNDIAPVTLVGMVDGTMLTYDPPIPGGPAKLDQGEVAILETDLVFTVKSQDENHPFYVAAHMTGSGTGSGIGDPEYVNVIPPDQYLPSYLFVTDPSYRNTVLVFVRKHDEAGAFRDVTLDCAGPLTGWQPVGSGEYEVARVFLVQNGADVGGCSNGVHTATSEVPFGLTVWGYDIDVSYAYPAGMSLEPINSVVVPPIPK